ncbi:TetR/AcrR family transcriptional regulator [Aeromonas diversa]|uniref:TetR/AcrR family transcriptional regulator n=1 Tax=Aeromonas diversa TaxID=502790 RepID=UPI00346189A9
MLDKRSQILDAALTLCAEEGTAGAATARIAKAAGVANGTLFHHFPNKEALILCLYQEIKGRLAAALQPPEGTLPLKAQAYHYWEGTMNWLLAHPRELRFLLGFFHSAALPLALRSRIINETLTFLPVLLAEGMRQGVVRPCPLPLLMEACQGQFLACAALFVAEPERSGDPEWHQAAFDLFWHAIARSAS